VTQSSLCIVTEWHDLGSALGVLRASRADGRAEGFGETDALVILKAALAALAYLHAQGKMHRNLKASNLLLHAATGAVRISDFSLSQVRSGARAQPHALRAVGEDPLRQRAA
jgi:serine/threonine protein kinase